MPSIAVQSQRVLPKLAIHATFPSARVGINSEEHTLIPPKFLAASRPVGVGLKDASAVLSCVDASGCYMYDLSLDQLIASWSAPLYSVFSAKPCFIANKPDYPVEVANTDHATIDDITSFSMLHSSLSGKVYSSFLFYPGDEPKSRKAKNTKDLYNRNEIWAWNSSHKKEGDDSPNGIDCVCKFGPITDSTRFIVELAAIQPTVEGGAGKLAVLHVDGSITLLDEMLQRTITTWKPAQGKKGSTTKVLWSKSFTNSTGESSSVTFAYVSETKTTRGKPEIVFRVVELVEKAGTSNVIFRVEVERFLDEQKVKSALRHFFDDDFSEGSSNPSAKKKSLKLHLLEIDFGSLTTSFDYCHMTKRLGIFTPKSAVIIKLGHVLETDTYLGIYLRQYFTISSSTAGKEIPQGMACQFIGSNHLVVASVASDSERPTICIFDTRYGSFQRKMLLEGPSSVTEGQPRSNRGKLFINLDVLSAKDVGTSILVTLSETIPGSSILDFKCSISIVPFNSGVASLADALGKGKFTPAFLSSSKHAKKLAIRESSGNIGEDGSLIIPLPGSFAIAKQEPYVTTNSKAEWEAFNATLGALNIKAKSWAMSFSDARQVSQEELEKVFSEFLKETKRGSLKLENLAPPFVSTVENIVFGSNGQQQIAGDKESIILKVLIENGYFSDVSAIDKAVKTLLANKNVKLLVALINGCPLLSENAASEIIRWTISGSQTSTVEDVCKAVSKLGEKSNTTHVGPLTTGQSALCELVFAKVRNDIEMVKVFQATEFATLLKWCVALLGVDMENGTTAGVVPLFGKSEGRDYTSALRILRIILDASFNSVSQSPELDELVMTLGRAIVEDVELIAAMQQRLLGALEAVVPEAREEQRVAKELLKMTSAAKADGSEYGMRYRRMLRDMQGAPYQVEDYTIE